MDTNLILLTEGATARDAAATKTTCKVIAVRLQTDSIKARPVDLKSFAVPFVNTLRKLLVTQP